MDFNYFSPLLGIIFNIDNEMNLFRGDNQDTKQSGSGEDKSVLELQMYVLRETRNIQTYLYTYRHWDEKIFIGIVVPLKIQSE